MNQGCPGEGKDSRILGWLICPLQRFCSWKSDVEPTLHTLTIGVQNAHWPDSIQQIQAAVGFWPPYIVVNVKQYHQLGWRMFRLGWRYDKQWKGYIGPAGAFKKVLWPLLYY